MNWPLILGVLFAAMIIFQYGYRGRRLAERERLLYMSVGFGLLILVVAAVSGAFSI